MLDDLAIMIEVTTPGNKTRFLVTSNGTLLGISALINSVKSPSMSDIIEKGLSLSL